MNYYEHHIGDYAEATAHLSFIEDAAYSRMIRKYYATEKPLPADINDVQRLIGARTREEKRIVKVVLEEFFSLREDGWHNDRCDEELAEYAEGAEDREQRKANERDRKRKHRERRKELFDQVRALGIVPPFKARIEELEAILAKNKGRSGDADKDGSETVEGRGTPVYSGRPGDGVGTAAQSPSPKPQAPSPNSEEEDSRRGEDPTIDQALFREGKVIFGSSAGGLLNKAIKAIGKPALLDVIEKCRSKDPEAARAYLVASINRVNKPDDAEQRRIFA